jgi:hypothetical protein
MYCIHFNQKAKKQNKTKVITHTHTKKQHCKKQGRKTQSAKK